MKINIKERVLLGHFCPLEGDIVTMSIIDGIKEKTKLSEDEQKKHGVTFNGSTGKLAFKPDHLDDEIDVEFTKVEIEILQAGAERLNKQKKITLENMNLYKKLIELV